MIVINYKVTIIIILIILSFFNNLLNSYDYLKEINENIDVECFLYNIDNSVKIEKPFITKIKTFCKYLIFYIFFYNVDNPISAVEVMNY